MTNVSLLQVTWANQMQTGFDTNFRLNKLYDFTTEGTNPPARIPRNLMVRYKKIMGKNVDKLWAKDGHALHTIIKVLKSLVLSIEFFRGYLSSFRGKILKTESLVQM